MMFVDYMGEVIICSHDWGKKLIAGNLKKKSVVEVWTGRIMNNVRKKLAVEDRGFSPCNECDVKGTFMGGEHFKKWQECYKNNTVKETVES